MKTYDFEKAKRLIEKHKPISANLGMKEDWFWTAEEVYSEKDGYKLPERGQIAGIDGSCWATPILKMIFKDGVSKCFSCFIGESSGKIGPTNFLGCLSGPVQDAMDLVELETENE